MAKVIKGRSPWIIGGQEKFDTFLLSFFIFLKNSLAQKCSTNFKKNITISDITLKLEWNYAGNILRGYAWEKSWVRKGNLRLARTGNVAEIFNDTIWVIIDA